MKEKKRQTQRRPVFLFPDGYITPSRVAPLYLRATGQPVAGELRWVRAGVVHPRSGILDASSYPGWRPEQGSCPETSPVQTDKQINKLPVVNID